MGVKTSDLQMMFVLTRKLWMSLDVHCVHQSRRERRPTVVSTNTQLSSGRSVVHRSGDASAETRPKSVVCGHSEQEFVRMSGETTLKL